MHRFEACHLKPAPAKAWSSNRRLPHRAPGYPLGAATAVQPGGVSSPRQRPVMRKKLVASTDPGETAPGTKIMAHSQSNSPLRAKARKSLRILAALLAVSVIYVAVVGIDVDVTPKANEIAGQLSATLGRDIGFTGTMQLEISAHPTLRLSGLRIGNARGFSDREFAHLGEARLALNLWPLLWGRLQVDELSGHDAHLLLQTREDGTSNWTFPNPAAPVPPGEPAKSAAPGQALALLDIRKISVEKLDVEYVGPNGLHHYFQLDSLNARIPANEPVSLTLSGSVEKSFPYRVEFSGGTLSELIAAERPWPVDLSLTFLSSQLRLKGALSGPGGNLHFDLATRDLKELERLLQTRLPAVGQTHVAGDVTYAPGRFQLANLNGSAGDTTFNGAVDVDHQTPRPKVSGSLSLPVLDLRPFMTGQPEAEEAPTQSLAELYRDLARAQFDLHALNGVDLELDLRVGKWLNIPGAIRDAELKVKLDHGLLTMPIRATMADVTVSGRALVDARRGPARFDVALGAHDSGIGNLSGLLLGVPDVNGHLGRFDLHVAARGNRGADLMESLVVDLGVERAKLSYGNGAGARPVQFSLDQFKLELPAGKPLRGEAHGTLVDNSFTMHLQGASLTELLRGDDATINFALQTGSAEARVHATLQPVTDHSGPEVHFSLHAPHSREVSSWLGLKPGADAPVSLKGDYQARAHGWLLSGLSLQLGRSRLASEIRQTQDQGRPFIRFQLTGELIDADELKSLLPEAPTGGAKEVPSSTALIDIPVLPQGISFADADITVGIKEIATTSPFTVRDLRFDGRIRDGMMSHSPFSARVANTEFYGVIMIDLRTQQPRATLSLAADAMDTGALLHRLDIAPHLDARLEHLGVYMDLRSSRLGDLISNSELSLSFEGGKLTLHDANTADAMHIALDRGELRSIPGSPVRLHLDGAVNAERIRINVETGSAAALLDPASPIPFKLDADTSGATIRLSGNVDRPLSQQEVDLSLDMHGSRFDNLNHLLRASLPPWGPWAASGRLHMSAAGYEVSSLLMRVGSSELTGHGKLDTQALPPRLEVELAAPTIQIDDFRFGQWSPEAAPPGADNDAPAARSEKAGTGVEQLLSREMLRRQDVRLVVRVDQVLSGHDVLGNGQLDATLQNGRAVIGPAIVNTPGGTAMVRLHYEPGEKDVALNLRAAASHFDYGILARRIDKQSGMAGTFDLDVDVSARAKNVSELLRNGKGHIDFAVWPQNMKSGLLDIWAVNVLMALLPAVDASQESVVNCAIGQFTLKDGKLSQKNILVDTTRMRVAGKGHADFTTEQLQFYMRPRSKTPQFLSFPLPVEVSGSFTEFSVGVRPGDVLETAGQFATSVIWVPLQSLFGTALPADGHDVCRLK